MSRKSQEPLPDDATQVDEPNLLGKRRVSLSALTVRFQATANETEWRQLFRKLKLVPPSIRGEFLAPFAALPRKREPLLPYLVGSVALHPDLKGVSHWEFTWARMPDEPPPDEILASSAQTGGFPGILERLSEVWPANHPLNAEVSASYLFVSTSWRFRFSSMRPKRLRWSDRSVGKTRMVPARWEFEPPVGPIRAISRHLTAERQVFKLTAEGHYTFQWSPRFLNEVDGAVWSGLRNFLERL